MTEPSPSKRNIRGERSRAAILNAAEKVFLRAGYEGASIRDIAVAADVPLGAVHYHFAAKQQLLHATVWRREPEIRALIEQSYADAHARSAPAQLSVEEVVDAYLRPLLSVCHSEGHALRDYVRLTSLMTTSFHLADVRAAMHGFTRINDLLLAELRPTLSDISETDLHGALYALVATIIFAEQDSGFVNELTDGAFASDHLERMIEPISMLFAAGLRYLDRRA